MSSSSAELEVAEGTWATLGKLSSRILGREGGGGGDDDRSRARCRRRAMQILLKASKSETRKLKFKNLFI